jgi:SAM-dependent methyltransferase
MKLATHSDFHGGSYTHYRHHEGFAKRARLLSTLPAPLLIVGCGFGFTVQELRALGVIAWGVDVSEYAFSNRACGYVYCGDILARDRIGIMAAQYGTVITEDLLPCLTDKEARLAAVNCIQLSPLVIHFVTEHGQAQDLNYHPCGYWMALTQQLTVSLEGM